MSKATRPIERVLNGWQALAQELIDRYQPLPVAADEQAAELQRLRDAWLLALRCSPTVQ